AEPAAEALLPLRGRQVLVVGDARESVEQEVPAAGRRLSTGQDHVRAAAAIDAELGERAVEPRALDRGAGEDPEAPADVGDVPRPPDPGVRVVEVLVAEE